MARIPGLGTRQQMAAAPPYLRDAVRQALWEAVERAPGNRAAALRRARDELLQALSRTRPPGGGSTADDSALRSALMIEVEAAAAELLRRLAGRG